MAKIIKILFLALAVFFLLFSFGCSGRSLINLKEETKNGCAEITEEMLVAFNEGNYNNFSKHFSQDMKNSLTAEDFKESLAASLYEKIGKYEPSSKKFLEAYKENGFISVYYKAEFSKDDVMVNVVFGGVEDKIKIEGLWFDSPKLRK